MGGSDGEEIGEDLFMEKKKVLEQKGPLLLLFGGGESTGIRGKGLSLVGAQKEGGKGDRTVQELREGERRNNLSLLITQRVSEKSTILGKGNRKIEYERKNLAGEKRKRAYVCREKTEWTSEGRIA